jgi:glucarate dehydratase
MKVTDIKVTPVTVPMEAPLRWSMGVETGTTRDIIEVNTDEGITGIGETYGGIAVEHAIDVAKPFVIRLEPLLKSACFNTASVSSESVTRPQCRRRACGHRDGLPGCRGKGTAAADSRASRRKFRDRIEVSAYLFFRYKGEGDAGGEASPEAIRDRAQQLVERHGFRVLKFKGGVLPSDHELQTLRLLQRHFPEKPLRWDPNAAWSVETSMRVCRRLRAEAIELEYLEDPTWNLEGMSQVREVTDIPLATNMCLVSFDQLAPGIRLRSVDIVLADVHFWGGFCENQRMMAVCDAFQLGVGMHCDRELGISTALMLHLAPSSPSVVYAIDSHYHDQVDVIITTPFTYQDGHFTVPQGPGLGVEVDFDKA